MDLSISLRSAAEEYYFPYKVSIRSPKTLTHYRFAFDFLDRFLGRAAQVRDLNDATITKFLRWLDQVRGLAPKTINERVGRIISVWDWFARKRYVEQFPTVEKLPEPKRCPRAWTIEQLAAIFSECRRCRGYACGIPISIWMTGLLGFGWNTSERIGATLQTRFDMIDFSRGSIIVPAEIRKKGQSDELYELWPEVVETMLEIKSYGHKLIFPMDFCISALYHRYKKILQRAGLPDGRKYMFHCVRVTHGTWVEALGGNASLALRHSNPATTKRHYIDTSIASPQTTNLPHSFIRGTTT